MSKIADYIIGRIDELAKSTGYTFDYLWDIWTEMCEDGDTDFELFEGITLEHDW